MSEEGCVVRGFSGIKAAVCRMIPVMRRITRDKCALFQINISEKAQQPHS